MSPIVTPSQKFARLAHCLPILFILAVFPVKISAEQGVLDLLRAGRWSQLQRYFQSRGTSSDIDRYALARAYEEKARSAFAAKRNDTQLLLDPFARYFQLLGQDCRPPTDRDAVACLGQIREESVKPLIGRLALLRLSGLFRTAGFTDARLLSLTRASMAEWDPLTEEIYSTRLEGLLARSMNTQAVELAGRSGTADSARTHYFRARAFMRGGKRDDGWNLYLLAASRALSDPPMLRSIFQDMKFYFPQVFRPGADRRSMHRALVMFVDYMTPLEKAQFAQAWPVDRLKSTAAPSTVAGDGLLLLSTNQASEFSDLAAKSYTHVSRNPWILYRWTARLMGERRYPEAHKLLDQFAHVKKENAGVWKLQLAMLKTADRERYFRELVAYLAVFDSDLEEHDHMIEWLIGDNHRAIRWAAPQYWELARQALPSGTANGRFVYWLKRFYKANNDPVREAEILKRFYELAPGSYYSRAFWDELPAGDFRRDWRDVRDRTTYLHWVGRHGGNTDAVRFLAGKNLTAYHDPKAVEMWNRLQSLQYSVPEQVVLLWKLGELELGQEFFDHHFKDQFSRRETFLRRVVLGLRSGHLYQSVWYMRQITRDENIPEDPFSLPSDYLRHLYPRPYLREVRSASSEYALPEEMIYALMRQESMYKEMAVSRSGALGLMQVMPATGRWLAPGMRTPNPDLLDPHTSIRFGAKFFSDLLRQFGNDFRWASIAYNGGPGALGRWKQQYYHGDFNLFLENLPVAEPRHYCRVTFQNYMHYRTAYTLYP